MRGVMAFLVVLAIGPPAAPAAGTGDLFFDVMPTVISQRAVAPMRPLLEWLGAKVDYRDSSIVASRNQTVLKLKVGDVKAVLAGNEFELEVPPTNMEGRVMLPLKFVAEAFGAWVDYLPGSRQIKLSIPTEHKEVLMATPPHPKSDQAKMWAVVGQFFWHGADPGLLSRRLKAQLVRELKLVSEADISRLGTFLTLEEPGAAVKGLRVERDSFDGRLAGWLEVVVLTDKVQRARVDMVREVEGWRIDRLQVR